MEYRSILNNKATQTYIIRTTGSIIPFMILGTLASKDSLYVAVYALFVQTSILLGNLLTFGKDTSIIKLTKQTNLVERECVVLKRQFKKQAVIGLCIIMLVALLINDDITSIVLLSIPTAYFIRLNRISLACHRALNRPRTASALENVLRNIIIAISVLSSLFIFDNIFIIILAFGIAYLLIAYVTMMCLPNLEKTKHSKADIKTYEESKIYFWANSNLTQAISTQDLYIGAHFLSLDQFALYTIANKALQTISSFSISFNFANLDLISNAITNHRPEALKNAINKSSILLGAVCFISASLYTIILYTNQNTHLSTHVSGFVLACLGIILSFLIGPQLLIKTFKNQEKEAFHMIFLSFLSGLFLSLIILSTETIISIYFLFAFNQVAWKIALKKILR